MLMVAVAGPMAKVLCVCVIGYLCASPRIGLLGPPARSALSRLNVNIFLPPFLFATLSKSINLSNMLLWWPIPVFVVMNIFLGALFGLALVHVLGLQRTREHRGLILAACACGNVSCCSLTLAFLVLDADQTLRRSGRCVISLQTHCFICILPHITFEDEYFPISACWVRDNHVGTTSTATAQSAHRAETHPAPML